MYIFLFSCTYDQNIPHEPFVHTNSNILQFQTIFSTPPATWWVKNWCRLFSTTKTYLLGTTRMELSWKMKVNTRSLLPRWVGVGVGPFYALQLCAKTWKKKSDFVKIFDWMWEWMDFMNPSDETSIRKRRVGLCFVEIPSLKVWTTTWSHDCSPWRPGSC